MKVKDILELLAENEIGVHDEIKVYIHGERETYYPCKIERKHEIRFDTISLYVKVVDKHTKRYKKEMTNAWWINRVYDLWRTCRI